MVQYTVQDYRKKTIIWYNRRYGEEQILSNTISSISYECDSEYVHTSLDSALSLYANSTTELLLWSEEVIDCPNILQHYPIIKSLYMQSINILDGTSAQFFCSDTVQSLNLYIVHGIADMGQMPNLNSIYLKYCTLSRIPDLLKYPKLESVTMKHCVIEQSAYTIEEQLHYYHDHGIKLYIDNIRDNDLRVCSYGKYL